MELSVTGGVCMCVLVVGKGSFHRGLRQSLPRYGGPTSHASVNSESHSSCPNSRLHLLSSHVHRTSG